MIFEGEIVLITGAAHNTGLDIAKAFAKEGAVIALNDRRAEDVASAASMLRQNYRAKVLEVPADIGSQDAVDAMFLSIRKTYDRLDILINNAVLQGIGHSFTGTPRHMLEDIFSVNVFGAFSCTQHAVALMETSNTRAIVNIGSNTVDQAIRNRAAYIASKGASDALTRALAIDLSDKGIRVNSVVAGYIHSNRWDSLTSDKVARRRDNVPLGREAMGSDIADAVLFLSSKAANKITGTRLVVDGGMSAQLTPLDCEV